jgi:hypothetical protein
MYMDFKCWPGKASVNTILCGATVGLFVVMPVAFLGDSWILVSIGVFCAVFIIICAYLPSEIWKGICETRDATARLEYSSYPFQMLIAELARIRLEYEGRRESDSSLKPNERVFE